MRVMPRRLGAVALFVAVIGTAGGPDWPGGSGRTTGSPGVQAQAQSASEAAALEICRQDVYTKNGIWVEFRIRAFNRVYPAD